MFTVFNLLDDQLLRLRLSSHHLLHAPLLRPSTQLTVVVGLRQVPPVVVVLCREAVAGGAFTDVGSGAANSTDTGAHSSATSTSCTSSSPSH